MSVRLARAFADAGARAATIACVVCAAGLVGTTSCASSSGGAGGGPGLDARYVAVHNALASTGWSEIGPLRRGVVTRGGETRVPVTLRAPCTTVVVFGGEGTEALDAQVVDPTGKLIARAETSDPSPVVKACVAEAGTYTLVVSAPASGGARGDFLAAEFAGDPGTGPAKPSNDGTCAAPFPLAEGRTTATTARGHAELEGSCASSQGKELVYRLELKERKRLTVDVDPKFDAVLYLRKESCSEDDLEVACNDDSGQARHSKIEEELDPGVYFVVVDGYGNESGAFKMDVSLGAAEPVSLACSRAPELLASSAIKGSWSGESNHATGSCNSAGSGPDVVYKWTERKTERVRFTVSGSAPTEPTSIFVRASCDDADSEVACQQMGAGASSVARVMSPGEYLVFADGVSVGPSGDYQLRTEVAPAEGMHVPGDTCADALGLRPGEVVHGDTFAARDDVAESCGGRGAPDIVYRLEVPVRSFLRVTLDASSSGQSLDDAVLGLSRGCGGARREVACGDAIATVVDPGSWFLTVDGRRKDELGAFALRAELRDVRHQEQACRAPTLLPPGKMVEASTHGAGDGFLTSCAQPGTGASITINGSPVVAPPAELPAESSPDRVYKVVVKQPGVLHAQVTADGWEPVLALRSACVESPRDSEIACDADGDHDGKRVIEAGVNAGVYFLVIDGRGTGNEGKFRLSYTISQDGHAADDE